MAEHKYLENCSTRSLIAFLESRDPGITERTLDLSQAAAAKHVRVANRYFRDLRKGGDVFFEALNEDDIFMEGAEPLKIHRPPFS